MKIKKIFAICLLVDSYEKSFDFYTNVLGFEVNSKDGVFTDFKLGETSLAIFQKDGAEGMFPRKYMKVGGSAVIAFQVSNLEKFCKNITEKGINIFEGPKTTEWGQKVAYIQDPDSNIIEISED